MYQDIICGHDGQDGGDDAVAFGEAIRQATGARLRVVGVFPDGPFVDQGQQVEFARKVQAEADKLRVEADAFPSSSPARGLHDAAEELEADLVVVGSSNRIESGKVAAGHVGRQLLHGSPCAVAVAPAGARERGVDLSTIGVAFDGSAESQQALDVAVELARVTGAKLHLITALTGAASAFGWGYGVIDLEDQMEEVFGARQAEAANRVPEDIEVTTELVSRGGVADLIRTAAEQVDLLCLGSRGYGPVRRVLLGSISAALVEEAPCALLVVPRGVAATGAGGGDTAVTETAR